MPWIELQCAGLLAAFSLAWTGLNSPAIAATDEPAGPAAVAQATDVGLVDMNRVLKSHVKFNLTMNALKVGVNETEQRFMLLRAEIADLEKSLIGLKPGSEEHQQLAEKILLKKNEFTGQTQVEKQRLLNEEAAAYALAYKDISAHIQKYADEHGLRLVLRASSEPPKLNTREEVLQAYNNPVLYQRGLDITDEIIKRVSSKTK